MRIENQKDETPFVYYAERFREANPEEIRRRLPDVEYENGAFRLKLLGRTLCVTHPDYSLRAEDDLPLPGLPTQTLLLRYLLESRNWTWSGSWKTFRELPWGEPYVRAFHGRVLTRAAFTFGTRIDAFRSAAEKLGAEPAGHGDAGYTFSLVGDYRMQLLIWEGDEEFPPSAQILYSDNFGMGFSAEDRVVAADILIGEIKKMM